MNILHHTNIFEEGSEDEGAAGGQEKYASIDKYKEETPQEKIQRGFEREKKKRKIGKMKNFLQSQMVQGQKKDLFKMQEIRQQHRIVNLDIDEQVSEVATVEQRRLQKGATLSDFIRKKEASHIFQNKKLLDSQDHPDFEKRKREMEKSKKDKNQLGKVMEEIKSVYVDKYADTLAKIQLEIDQKEIEKKAKLEEKKSNPAFNIQEQEQEKPEKTVKTSELKYKKRKEAKKILPKLSPTITSSNTTIMGHFPEEPEVSEAVGKLVDETFTSRKDSSSSVTVEDSTDIAMEDLTRHEQNELIGKYPGESIKAFNDKRMDIDKKEHRSKREERKHQDSWHNLFKEEMTITNFKRVKQMDKVEPKPNKKLFKLGGFDAHFD